MKDIHMTSQAPCFTISENLPSEDDMGNKSWYVKDAEHWATERAAAKKKSAKRRKQASKWAQSCYDMRSEGRSVAEVAELNSPVRTVTLSDEEKAALLSKYS